MLVNKKTKKKKKREKECLFPECTTSFFGIGPAKYCTMHRKPEYRKIINKMKLEQKKELFQKSIINVNQEIKHKLYETSHQVHHCALKGCPKKFNIIIYPRTFVYPKYCPEHRNAHKRNLFVKLKEQKNI